MTPAEKLTQYAKRAGATRDNSTMNMRAPITLHLDHIDATILVPQASEVTRFKATFPVYSARNRMLAPLYAELIERGTKSKARKEFAAALERLGAQLGVGSDRFGITVEGCALSRTFPSFLTLVTEMLREPAFSGNEMAQVHTQYAQYIHDEEDDARAQAYNAFTQTLFNAGHPYYKPSAETRRAFLKTVTRKTYLDFHRTLLTADIKASISGPDATQKAAVKLFSSLSRSGDAVPPPTLSSTIHKGKTSYRSVPGKVNVELYIGNTLPFTLADAAFLPFQFGLAVLGKWGGFSGRLMSTVREKEGLTYTIFARTEGATKTQSGMWYVFTFFTPVNLDRGIAATKREITRITEKGVTEKEILRFKELLKNQFILAHDSDSKALALYHDALCAGITAPELASRHDALQYIRRNDIHDALAWYLDADRLVISGAGPVTSKGNATS